MKRCSLAAESGRLRSALVSTCICAAHVLFAYAQLSGTGRDCPGVSSSAACPLDLPDDGLVEVRLQASVRWEARNVLALGLSRVEDMFCHGNCTADGKFPKNTSCAPLLQCDYCFDKSAMFSKQQCALTYVRSVMHLSYIYMIRELWERDQCPECYQPTDPCCTGFHPGRPAVFILVGASFIWPHVKLALLHLTFYMPLLPATRRNRNYWLAFFGKWTLTDVLVWCMCLGVFHGA
jgi:hypothetical protein